MFNSIFTSRLYVPVLFIFYGLSLFVLRIITLDCNEVNINILLALFTSIAAIFTWAIDMA